MPTSTTDVFLHAFLDSLPDGAVYHRAIPDSATQTPDFELVYANEQAAGFARFLPPLKVGQRLSASNARPWIEAYQSGETRTNQDHVEICRRKLHDGVLTLVRSNSAGYLRRMLDHVSVGVVALEALRDATGRVVDFRFSESNEMGRQLANLPADAIGRRLLDVLPSHTETGLLDAYAHVVESGEPFIQDFLSEEEGQHTWFSIMATKLEDGIVVTFRDITRQKMDTDRIAAQARLLDGVLNASLHGILTYASVRDEAGKIVDFRCESLNQVSAEMLGLPDREAGWRMLERYPATVGLGTFARYVDVVETNQSQRFETHYDADGLSGWYEVSAVKLEDGFVLTFNDISETRNAVLENEQQRSLLASVFENSPFGISVYESIRDTSGQIVDYRTRIYNRLAYELLDFSETQMRDATMLERSPAARSYFEGIRRIEENGGVWLTEYGVPDSDRWIQAQVARFDQGVIITTRDITESREVLRQIESQKNLLAGVLNTSLNGTVVYEAIRDAQGAITDFRFPLFNETARLDILHRTGHNIQGNTLLNVYPDSRESGLFALYARATEGGPPMRLEHHYPDLDVWYDVSINQLNDGCVVTFIDISESKRVTRAIQQQSELLTSVLDGSVSGILACRSLRDATGTLIDFEFISSNQTAADILFKSLDELVGGRLLKLFPGNVETGLFDLYKRTAETGEPGRTETYYNHDGLDFWLDITSRQLGDGVVITFTDISEAKRAQHAVERQANLLNTVLNSSTNGITALQAVRDQDGRILDFMYLMINKIGAELGGKTIEELVGKRASEVYPSMRQTGLFELYETVIQTGEPQESEIHYLGEGIDRWLAVSIRKQDDGVVVTYTDVTVVRRVTQQIERSAQELQMVIDTSQTGIFLFTPIHDESGTVIDFRFRVANRQLAAYVGQEPAAVIGALGSQWFPGYQTNGLFERYRDTYLTGKTNRFDFHYDDDGIDVWLDIMSTKLGDEVLVTFADYTPLKRLQLELEGTVQKLQTSNENLERFAYVASHDLQEPLRKIQSFGDMIFNRHALTLPPDAADKLSRMQAAAERMQNLINDLLAYSRLSSVKESFRRVDLARLLGEVRADLDLTIREKKATLKIDPLPVILGDSLQLQQLFQNLLSNAFKFTPANVTPRVEVRHRTVYGDEVPDATDLNPRTRYHEIIVRDNGIGFEQQYAAQVFEAFRRLHNRAEYPGTGIGLAIVKKVVENHHGDVLVQSQLGEGTTFRVYLPTHD